MPEAIPVVIYPRGYLGFDIGIQGRSLDSNISTIINNFKFNKATKKSLPDVNKKYIINDEIEDSYNCICKGTPGINTMEFREKVIRACLKAFGTTNFYSWCELQAKHAKLSDIQVRFINDTLEFIKTGKRQMDVVTWEKLAHKSTNTSLVSKVSDIKYKEYFGIGKGALLHRPLTVVSVIQEWLKHNRGFEDMVVTMKIFFGAPAIK